MKRLIRERNHTNVGFVILYLPGTVAGKSMKKSTSIRNYKLVIFVTKSLTVYKKEEKKNDIPVFFLSGALNL